MIQLATVASIVFDVGRGLREGFFMFWETLWALVLGFTLSGVVQAFVSKDQMRAALGSHRPSAIARASGYGMVSSSCSYAASAMTKSLFAKGADFTSAMVFMFASTNLVIELGIVMLVLLGWQFMAAEFVGGPIMIILLALSGGVVFAGPLVARARRRLATPHEGHDHETMSGVSAERQEELEAETWNAKVTSPAAWADASSYAVADATMLRKELAIGYVVAGLLAALVPTHAWNDLFLHGHGFWTSLENALVGPLIAVISWVCSIGNVPLAAALWSGGIAFGGVIAFVFADLISMPLILIYRKFYGTKLTLRMVGLFYVLMASAGLATEGIFSALGIVPSRRTVTISSAHFQWNYTTFLNFIFLALAAAVWWMARNRARFGGGEGYAIDPVCAMQVRVTTAPATAKFEGRGYYFCSDRCRERFEADPTHYNEHHTMPTPMDEMPGHGATAVDPVCMMTIETATAAAHRVHEGHDVWFCNVSCAASFDADPTKYPLKGSTPMSMNETPASGATAVDPVCMMTIETATAAAHRVHEGHDVWFCNVSCAASFDADPGRYLSSK